MEDVTVTFVDPVRRAALWSWRHLLWAIAQPRDFRVEITETAIRLGERPRWKA